jgi:hypothetical protein
MGETPIDRLLVDFPEPVLAELRKRRLNHRDHGVSLTLKSLVVLAVEQFVASGEADRLRAETLASVVRDQGVVAKATQSGRSKVANRRKK